MTKYFNEGWFGQHPVLYEFASYFISSVRKTGARKMGLQKLKILDIATGTGAHALVLARLKHDVTGIDLDIKMLEKANKKKSPALHLTFKHEDGTNIQCNDHVYDAATISFAMHDVPYDIGIKLLQEAKRVISKTGFILIVDYNDLSGFGSRLLYFFASMYESPNYKPFVRRGLASYLLESGFHVESKSTFLGAVQYVTARPV